MSGLEALGLLAMIADRLPKDMTPYSDLDKAIYELRLAIAREAGRYVVPHRPPTPPESSINVALPGQKQIDPRDLLGPIQELPESLDTKLIDAIVAGPAIVAYRESADGKHWHTATLEETCNNKAYWAIPHYADLRDSLVALAERVAIAKAQKPQAVINTVTNMEAIYGKTP